MTELGSDDHPTPTLTSSGGRELTAWDSTADAMRPVNHPSVLTGAQLGEYRLERRLGAGGMGEVFAARRSTGELVALKLLSATSATRLYRFKREFRTLADLAHPNLVRLYELTIPKSGVAYFTME